MTSLNDIKKKLKGVELYTLTEVRFYAMCVHFPTYSIAIVTKLPGMLTRSLKTSGI